MRKSFSIQQTKSPSLKAFPGLFVLNEEAITPRISNTALNCYASPSSSPNPNPSPNCRDGRKCKETIAVNGQAREALPDARRNQTHAVTRANVWSLMASTRSSGALR